MKRILKLKHWQLILLIIMPHFFSTIFFDKSLNEESFYQLRLQDVILSLYMSLFFFLWVASIAYCMEVKMRNGANNKSVTILFCFTATVVLQVLAVIAVLIKYYNILLTTVILNFFNFVYLLYKANFALSEFENQREVKKGLINLNFFYLILFPFGIWFLQPKLNEYFNE
jgi:hypothetical protein